MKLKDLLELIEPRKQVTIMTVSEDVNNPYSISGDVDSILKCSSFDLLWQGVDEIEAGSCGEFYITLKGFES